MKSQSVRIHLPRHPRAPWSAHGASLLACARARSGSDLDVRDHPVQEGLVALAAHGGAVQGATLEAQVGAVLTHDLHLEALEVAKNDAK